ncbi:MAG TPA: glycosyltransferase family 2 protein [Candidatus Accumulibacter phosphatis]|nr:glycosyltransferase family 2 protein [Candidatus Accumulibacter phosphatis]
MTTSISIVTCSYQQGVFLDKTLRSVLEQRYPALEYIVIDGGSTDQSVSVIKRHQQSLAYWISERDKGQTDALIKGFARAKGEVLGWLCSDDLLLPGALAKIGAFFASNPAVEAVYGDSLWMDASGQYLRPKKEGAFFRHAFLFDHNFVPQPSMFWRRRLYDKVGGLDARFDLAMDSDLWERFSRHARISHIPEYLSCMRFYPQQKTRLMRPQGQVEDLEVRNRSQLAAWPSLNPLFRLSGKALRVGAKLIAGGYGATVDKELIAALNAYRLRSDEQ